MSHGIALDFSVKGAGVPERLNAAGVENILFSTLDGIVLVRQGGEKEHVSYDRLSATSAITDGEVEQILIRRGRALRRSELGHPTLVWAKTLP